MVTHRSFTAIVHREEVLYVAECSEVGTVSQGATVEEALANLKEATELYLEEFPLPERGQPLLTTFEVAPLSRLPPGSPVAAVAKSLTQPTRQQLLERLARLPELELEPPPAAVLREERIAVDRRRRVGGPRAAAEHPRPRRTADHDGPAPRRSFRVPCPDRVDGVGECR